MMQTDIGREQKNSPPNVIYTYTLFWRKSTWKSCRI